MNRRQLLGAGIAAAVSSWLPWRSGPVRLLPPVVNPRVSNEAYIPEKWARGFHEFLKENMVVATIVHRDFTDDEKNGSHPRFLAVGPLAQETA